MLRGEGGGAEHLAHYTKIPALYLPKMYRKGVHGSIVLDVIRFQTSEMFSKHRILGLFQLNHPLQTHYFFVTRTFIIER